MNYADMILDSVGVANLDEVNLSYMIVSVVIFQKFTWLVPRSQLTCVPRLGPRGFANQR